MTERGTQGWRANENREEEILPGLSHQMRLLKEIRTRWIPERQAVSG